MNREDRGTQSFQNVWREKTYASLSTIAGAITGTAWSGPRFFGLRAWRDRVIASARQVRTKFSKIFTTYFFLLARTSWQNKGFWPGFNFLRLRPGR